MSERQLSANLSGAAGINFPLQGKRACSKEGALTATLLTALPDHWGQVPICAHPVAMKSRSFAGLLGEVLSQKLL